MKKSVATTSLLAGLILMMFLGYARTSDAQASSEHSQIQDGHYNVVAPSTWASHKLEVHAAR
jgi:hypothetical protein